MNIPDLQAFTSARVSLGRVGSALPTQELLKLQLAHARARQAIYSTLDAKMLSIELKFSGLDILHTHSAAPDRAAYLRRPDLGRRLDEEARRLLQSKRARFDIAFVIADGLSALAVQLHSARMIQALLGLLAPNDWKVSPIVIVDQGRVAIGDEVGNLLGATMSVVLIGERPGLSSADSLGIYLTWDPKPDLTDAFRNCISNIRVDGLSYEVAALRLMFLLSGARQRKLSGVHLKEEAGSLT